MQRVEHVPELAPPVSAIHSPWTSSATLAVDMTHQAQSPEKLKSIPTAAPLPVPTGTPLYIPATDDSSIPFNRIGPKAANPQIERVLTEGGPKKEKDVMNALLHQATRGEAPYPGKGTEEDPFIVDWLAEEKANPYNWKNSYKWLFTLVAAIVTLCVAFASSCYTGAASFLIVEFHVSREIIVLGVTLFVLGFAGGPLIWAPLSEIYGRRPIFLITYFPFALFCLGSALANNIATLLVTRFLAGFFGASMLTNAGGMIADVWNAKERGLATSLFAMAPFLGPVLGPIVGGFAGKSYLGWRSVFYIMFIFAMVMYIAGIVFLPESYAPVLVRRRAEQLQAASTSEGGPVVHYLSKYDKNRKSTKEILKVNLTRPFILLFCEPIVLMLSIYVAIIYGTLYLFFTAYPLVFQSPEPLGYGWNAGVGALPFIGIGVGMIIGTAVTPLTNKYYIRAVDASPTGRAPPEARLPPACFGAVCLPVGLAIFAATSDPKIHWIAPCIAGAPFGFGMILIFTSVLSYLIDSYMLFAASALAANAVLRSLFGAIFPLFSTYMYQGMGYRWASGLVAFVAFACTPMPFIFYKYGPAIRKNSRFAPEVSVAKPAASTDTEEKQDVDEKQPQVVEAMEPVTAVASRHSLVSRISHRHAHPHAKIPQPTPDSALEPEWGPDAGEPIAVREMSSVHEPKLYRGADAV
ncbi:hypothetical protein QFC21_006325 [Naganishia friedmannii]|uniref:Uncharacterized protein n=1 Tax=Naganishia friedmannii TaxID=89922 RepID=A0ACC2V307_9TREE|nr:hypothetical protein QFC21_006325 [Naganishia friedmannii]